MKLFAVKFRRILEVLCLQGLQKNFWAHFHDLCVQKWSCFLRSSDAFRKFSLCEVYKKLLGTLSRLFAMEFRRILEVHCLQVLQKRFWAHIHDFCFQKWSCLPWSSDAFWKFVLYEEYKKIWAHFHDLFVHKRSCLPWSSDVFLKFFACKFCRKGSGRIVMIYVSKNEAICCEVHTDFGSFVHESFMKKFWAEFHDLCVQKRNFLP